MGRTLKRGEVRWYKFPRPDKNRPVVILTRDSVMDFLGEVTVAPVTSVIRDIPSEVLLTNADGMSSDCVVNLDHIQTISKERIGPLITTLTQRKMAELRSALLFALGF
ncbi:type II toxin-antitoxin system PemK/MazF family toxin [bacterium]|nr:type II toxin-antitoxin system PemK/MazF family toxin [bacterium]MCI0602626.1 type II toxin-antitoxin system PemK/MazF family toxin [bacterium]